MDNSYLNSSIWNEVEIKLNKEKPVNETDILIIGAGMTGIMIAYELSKSNQNVVLVDSNSIASLVTMKTTAMITSMHNFSYQKIKKHHGLEAAKLYYDSQEEGIKSLLKNIDEHQIDCDLKKEIFYNYATTDSGKNKLNKEIDVLKKLKVPIKIRHSLPIDIKIKKAFSYDKSYSFHPMKYLKAIIEILEKQNVKILENYHVIRYEKNENNYLISFENGQKMKAQKVVVATNYPIFNESGFYFTKLYQEKDYVIAFETNKKIEGIYMNTDSPSAYLRSHLGVGILGGNSHAAGAKVSYDQLMLDLKASVFKIDKNATILNEWTNQDVLSNDFLPCIGNYSSSEANMYVATAYQAWGMSNSHVAAKLISDLILGKENRYKSLYRPSRLSYLKSPLESLKLVGKSINGLLLSRICIPKKTIAHLKKGAGGIIKHEGCHYAVYNTGSEYLFLKPNCPHAHCNLHFNQLELTWDCKCHGSRFDVNGNILYGPATKPLERIYFDFID